MTFVPETPAELDAKIACAIIGLDDVFCMINFDLTCLRWKFCGAFNDPLKEFA